MNSFFIIILTLIIIIILLAIYNKLLLDEFYIVSCKFRRFGCCSDELTPKLDIFGSNCRGF